METLYDFSNRFFEKNGVEKAAKKWEEVKGQMEEVVTLLDSFLTASKVLYVSSTNPCMQTLYNLMHSVELVWKGYGFS